MVPGIEPSPDKMLQARLFSYADTHRHRLGTNYQEIPVNKPFAAKVANYQRDGPMQVGPNGGGGANYFPNSFNGPAKDMSAAWHADKLTGDVQRVETGDEDNFGQCGDYFRTVLDQAARDRLTSNIAGHMVGAQEFIRQRAIANFAAVDASYGKMIADKVAALLTQGKGPAPAKKAAALNPPRSVPSNL